MTATTSDPFGPCPTCGEDWQESGPCGSCGLEYTDCMGGDVEHEPVSWAGDGLPVVAGLDACPRCLPTGR